MAKTETVLSLIVVMVLCLFVTTYLTIDYVYTTKVGELARDINLASTRKQQLELQINGFQVVRQELLDYRAAMSAKNALTSQEKANAIQPTQETETFSQSASTPTTTRTVVVSGGNTQTNQQTGSTAATAALSTQQVVIPKTPAAPPTPPATPPRVTRAS